MRGCFCWQALLAFNSPPQSGFAVLGNVGLGLTSLFVARNNLEGRRLGIVNLLAKILVAILVIVFVPRNLFLLEKLSIPVPQQLALMHTAFNLTVAVLSFPFLEWLLAFVKKTLVPDPPTSLEAPKTFLNPEALEAAPIALPHATRETLRMSDEVKIMFQNLWSAHIQNNSVPIRNIRSQDDTVDEINRQLMLYLSQIGEMNDFDCKWHFTLLSYAAELEAVGDIIEKNLAATIMKQVAENLVLNPDDEPALNHLYQKTLLQFDLAASFITIRENVTAQRVLMAHNEINEWCLAFKQFMLFRYARWIASHLQPPEHRRLWFQSHGSPAEKSKDQNANSKSCSAKSIASCTRAFLRPLTAKVSVYLDVKEYSREL